MLKVTAAKKVAGRRYASTAVGKLNGNKVVLHSDEKLPIRPREQVRILARRMRKSEREERMDISRVMSHPPMHLKSFTRPTELRATKRLPGGDHTTKAYEPPPDGAYQPYTAFLLESRYPVKQANHATTAYEHIVSVCREADLPLVLKHLNNPNSSLCTSKSKMAMDNAAWPFLHTRHKKPVVWWGPGENKDEVVAHIVESSTEFEDSRTAPTFGKAPQRRSRKAPDLALLSTSRASARSVQRRAMHTSTPARAEDEPDTSARDRANIKTSAWSKPPKPSQDADDNVVPTFYIERKKQRDDISERKEEEGSLMAELNAGILSEGLAASVKTREEKIPVELKLEDGSIQHASGFAPPTPEHEFHPVAAKQLPTEDPESILLTVKQLWDERDFAGAPEVPPIEIDRKVEAHYMKRLVQDIITPTDTPSADPTHNRPGPAGIFDPVAPASAVSTPQGRATIGTSSWDSPKRSTSNSSDPEEVVPPYYIERKRQRDSISERKEEEGGLMAELNAGILSEDVAATVRTRPEKIPVEVVLEDGTIAHPSGFEPPTAETDFHPASAKPAEAPPKTPWTELTMSKPSEGRGFHSSAIARATEVSGSSYLIPSLAVAPPSPAQQNEKPAHLPYGADGEESEQPKKIKTRDLKEIRELYMPLLAEQPFWRPLVTITAPTRPLAMSLAHFWRSNDGRAPYVSTVEPEERRDNASFGSRIRELRVNRARTITLSMAELLAGYRGGIVGLRFNSADKGRGVGGERIREPIPREHRVLHVGVADWYKYAEEVKEGLVQSVEEAGVADGVEIFGLDERGLRSDGKPWRAGASVEAADPDEVVKARADVDLSRMRSDKRARKIQELYEEHEEELKPIAANFAKLRGVVSV